MFGLQLPGHFSRGGPVAPTSHRARLSHPAGGGSRLPEAATSQSGDAGALGSEHRPRPGGCVPGRESPRQAPAAAVSPTHTSHQRGRAREVFTPPPPVCQSVSQFVHSREGHVWAPGTPVPASPDDCLLRTYPPHRRCPAAAPPRVPSASHHLTPTWVRPQLRCSAARIQSALGGDTAHAQGPGKRPQGVLGAEVLNSDGQGRCYSRSPNPALS